MTGKDFERYLELKEIKKNYYSFGSKTNEEIKTKFEETKEEYYKLEKDFEDILFENLNSKELLISKFKTVLRGISPSAYDEPEKVFNKVKSAREILYLLDTYDWKLMYSVYNTDDTVNRQIAIWEQNSDNQIRNHKTWNIK